MEIKRRILGTEEVMLIDGTKVEVQIYSIGIHEKNQASTRHRKKMVIGTGKDKSIVVDIKDDLIIEDLMNLSFQGQVEWKDIDSSENDIYDKYFNEENYTGKSKNCNTSESSEAKDEQ